MAAVAFVFTAAQLIRSGNVWMGSLYLLILLLPFEGATFLWLTRSRQPQKIDACTKWGYILFGLQGTALACWAFDLLTTFYAINITGLAVEANPLGWPLGAMGAFSYYVPTVVLSYFLLFRMKHKTCLFGAAPITAVALIMGSMNFVAAAGNLRLFLLLAMLPSAIRNNMLAIVVGLNIVCALMLATMARRQFVAHQRSLNAKLAS
jgi:hypothetical protein